MRREEEGGGKMDGWGERKKEGGRWMDGEMDEGLPWNAQPPQASFIFPSRC